MFHFILRLLKISDSIKVLCELWSHFNKKENKHIKIKLEQLYLFSESMTGMRKGNSTPVEENISRLYKENSLLMITVTTVTNYITLHYITTVQNSCNLQRHVNHF